MNDSFDFSRSSATLFKAASVAIDGGLGEAAPAFNLAAFLGPAQRILDFAAVFAAIYGADVLQRALEPYKPSPYDPSKVVLSAAGFAVLFVYLLERHGAYRGCISLLAIRETERVLRVTLQSFTLALAAAYFCAVPFSRKALFLALVMVPAALTLEKLELHRLVCACRAKGRRTRRAVILGSGPTAKRMYSTLLHSPSLEIDPVAFVDDNADTAPREVYESSYKRRQSAKVLQGPICPELFRQLDASVLFVATAGTDRASLLTATAALDAGIDTYFAPGDFLETGHWVEYTELDGIVLAHLSKGRKRVLCDIGKRALDIVLAATLLAGFSWIFAIVALLVKRSSPGPVLFRQERVGKDGRRFTIYKFRTMYQDAPRYGYSPTAGEDRRIIPIGRFLRRFSLDELPQLINVLLGEMSMVGPRPEMPFIVEQYSPLQRQRLSVKPGLTGLWQISGDRPFQIHENPEYDLYYFRVNIFYIQVPPLRERVDDIPILAKHLLNGIVQNSSRGEMVVHGSAMLALQRYSWAGNIRELRNVLERAALIAGDHVIMPEHLQFQSFIGRSAQLEPITGTLKQMERAYINHVLHDEGGSIERSARRLGIPRSSLYNKMKRFEIPNGTGRI